MVALIRRTAGPAEPEYSILEYGLEDFLIFHAFSELDARKTSSTNMLVRLNNKKSLAGYECFIEKKCFSLIITWFISA